MLLVIPPGCRTDFGSLKNVSKDCRCDLDSDAGKESSQPLSRYGRGTVLYPAAPCGVPLLTRPGPQSVCVKLGFVSICSHVTHVGYGSCVFNTCYPSWVHVGHVGFMMFHVIHVGYMFFMLVTCHAW